MLPIDTGGKINYSPGRLRPDRKFGGRTARPEPQRKTKLSLPIVDC